MTTEAPKLDLRDQLVQQQVPAVMMPAHTNFPPLAVNGHRLIVARDGLWLEVHRPWLHLVWPVALAPEPMQLPYGEVLADEMDFAWSDADRDALLDRFEEQARQDLPNESAAWGVWDANEQKLIYIALVPDESSPAGIDFQRPALPDHQTLAIDMHSHGRSEAGFSPTDDEDDAGEVKLAAVFGGIGTKGEGWVSRFCGHGLFIDFESAEDADLDPNT